MDEIKLYAGEKIIKMIVHEGEWCEVYWMNDDIVLRLGADSMSIVISKLLIAFALRENRDYFLNSEMFGVMALMDPLTTIAGRELNNSELELLCIEDGGNIISLVTLSIADIKRWIIQLTEFMINYNKS